MKVSLILLLSNILLPYLRSAPVLRTDELHATINSNTNLMETTFLSDTEHINTIDFYYITNQNYTHMYQMAVNGGAPVPTHPDC